MLPLDCYAVGMDIVQPEQVVVDRKDAAGAVANYFRVNIVVSGKREANGRQNRSASPRADTPKPALKRTHTRQQYAWRSPPVANAAIRATRGQLRAGCVAQGTALVSAVNDGHNVPTKTQHLLVGRFLFGTGTQ
jgi:hypothetical protein